MGGIFEIVYTSFFQDFKPPTKKATSAELRKSEKACRKLQQDLNAEKEKFNEMCAKLQKDLQDLQATLYEESQKSLKLSMELDTKVRLGCKFLSFVHRKLILQEG